MATFTDYVRAGFGPELLPIIPPGAELSPTSDIPAGSIGKIPGKLTRQGWVGFGAWAQHVATADDVKMWSRWPGAGIGMQGRNFPAIDIDVDDQELADDLELETKLALGDAPTRSAGGPRRLLLYAGAGLSKRRLVFNHAGRPFAVELLATGQQFIVEGVHPKSGRPYEWRDGRGPAAVGRPDVAVITAEDVDRLFAALTAYLAGHGAVDISDTGGGGSALGAHVPQDSLLAPSLEAVSQALSALENDLDYDAWFSALAMVKGATGGSAEGFDLFADWSATSGKDDPEQTQMKWDSLRSPLRVGWDQLARWAGDKGSGFSGAAHEFPAVETPEGGDPDDPQDQMFIRYAWIEGAKRAVELTTGDLLDQEQFEFRLGKIGRTSAWAVFKDSYALRTSYKNLTFRPGSGLEVAEDLPDLQGLCFNIWRAPAPIAGADVPVSLSEIQPYLDLAAHVMPIEAEREHVFDYCAYLVQHQDVKINHALVLGSRNEGMGKDTLFEPVRAAIGRRYVKEIQPQELMRQFNPFVCASKLVIVQEMHNFDRKETMNRLKPLVAAPPEALPVNLKNRQEFYVPNLLSMVFFTNEDDALSLSQGDRRYFVTWNDGEPRPKAFYEAVWNWLNAGGAQTVARFFMQRDVTAFDAKGRAPGTVAKETMRKAARPVLDEALDEIVSDEVNRDLVLVEELVRKLPDWALYKGQRPPMQRVGKALSRLGAVVVSEKIRLPGVEGSRRILALRNADAYRDLDVEAVRGLYIEQRKRAEQKAAESDFRETAK